METKTETLQVLVRALCISVTSLVHDLDSY